MKCGFTKKFTIAFALSAGLSVGVFWSSYSQGNANIIPQENVSQIETHINIPAHDRLALPAGTRLTENGLTAYDITLDDPLNLAPPARVVQDAIWNALETTPKDQTIVILMGEVHAMPTHQMTQICGMDALVQYRNAAPDDPARRFIMAYELPYDVLERYMSYVYDLAPPDNMVGTLHTRDPDGILMRKGIPARNPYGGAPQSMGQIFDYTLRQNIPMIPNDAANFYGGTLDPADPVAARIAQEKFKVDLKDRISPINNPIGMGIRNVEMVERALKQAKERGVRIILQQCGNDHLYGKTNKDVPYETSLAALYKAAGCKTVGVFIDAADHQPENVLPDTAWIENPDHIILRGLSDKLCTKQNTQEEVEFLDTLSRQFSGAGMGKAPFDFTPQKPTVNEVIEAYRATLQAAFNDLNVFKRLWNKKDMQKTLAAIEARLQF